MKRTLLLSLAAMAIVVAACGSAASPTPAPATPAPTGADAGDIVETATAAGSFTTLLTAATAAGLVDTLKGEGPFTVFAPTDDAFAALPEGTLDGLLADPEALKKVLLYHVVAGAVTADQVVKITSADSVEGSPIAIAVKDGMVYLNDTTKVVTTDYRGVQRRHPRHRQGDPSARHVARAPTSAEVSATKGWALSSGPTPSSLPAAAGPAGLPTGATRSTSLLHGWRPEGEATRPPVPARTGRCGWQRSAAWRSDGTSAASWRPSRRSRGDAAWPTRWSA